MAVRPGTGPWPHNFEAQPGDFGAMYQTLICALNTAGPALVGTATTTVNIGVPATKKFLVCGASIQGRQLFTSATTVTTQLIKMSGTTRTTLTAALDTTTATALSSAGYVAFAITANNFDATLNPGDTLWAEVAFGGTVLPTTADPRGCVEISINGTP